MVGALGFGVCFQLLVQICRREIKTFTEEIEKMETAQSSKVQPEEEG